MRENGFQNDIVVYIESKTKSDCRTYDMVCGKWKTVRPTVARFYGVFNNVKRMNPMSGVGDEDYYNTTTLNYEAEYEVKFTLRHCQDELRDSQKWNEIEVPNFLAKDKKGPRDISHVGLIRSTQRLEMLG